MPEKDLIQLIRTYGEEFVLKKGDSLFEEHSSDKHLYFIESGILMLVADGFPFVEVSDGEILGEKSFISGNEKKVGAKAYDDVRGYCLTRDSYNAIDIEVREEILGMLVIFLSNRVYKLNDILNSFTRINSKVTDNSIVDYVNFDFDSLLEKFIGIDEYIVLKNNHDDYQKLSGNLIYSEELEKFIQGIEDMGLPIKVGRNYLYLKSGKYIYLFMGKTKTDKYILVNTFLYSLNTFEFLGEKIENYKSSKILDTL